jgi:hypothetical protein
MSISFCGTAEQAAEKLLYVLDLVLYQGTTLVGPYTMEIRFGFSR